jgi:membrane-associated phospholipid phosphatase
VVLAATSDDAVRRLDGSVLEVVRRELGLAAVVAAEAIVDLGNPRQAVVLIAAVLVVAALNAPPARVVAIAVLLVGANGTGLLLEGCCERRVPTVLAGIAFDTPASAPSNHTILVASVGLAAMLVVPRALLGLTTALAAAATGAMAASLLVLAAHVSSDIVAGLLLVAGWLLVAVAVEPALRAVLPARAGPLPLRRAGIGVVALAGLAIAWVFGHRAEGRVGVVADAVQERPKPVVAGVLLALLAGAAVQAAAARRRSPPALG